MTLQNYAEELKSRITDAEREALQSGGLVISKYNRATVLELLTRENFPQSEVDIVRADALESALTAYLSKYMADKPEGWKWIIIASVYNAIICNKPMHPIEVVGIVEENVGGRTVYFCPARDESKGSLCLYCNTMILLRKKVE